MLKSDLIGICAYPVGSASAPVDAGHQARSARLAAADPGGLVAVRYLAPVQCFMRVLLVGHLQAPELIEIANDIGPFVPAPGGARTMGSSWRSSRAGNEHNT